MRTVVLVNDSTLVGPDAVRRCADALQVQVAEHFAATWGTTARVRVAGEPDEDDEALYLLDDPGQADALGHAGRAAGVRPCGFVFVRPCLEAGDAWQVM